MPRSASSLSKAPAKAPSAPAATCGRCTTPGRSGGDLPAVFYRREYALNHRIHGLEKPYVALMDGITMGGGVGVSVHGSHRVATERTLFAMPETGIGLFPDVGGSYFLPRLPGAIGMYLALTGTRLAAADCLYAGIATHCVAGARLDELRHALTRNGDVDRVLGGLHWDPGTPPLAAHRDAIDRCFAAASVADIIAALEAERTDWAAKQLEVLGAKSPTSLKVTVRQIRAGAGIGFAEAIAHGIPPDPGLHGRPRLLRGGTRGDHRQGPAAEMAAARLDQVTEQG